jgi:hypothetical protein
MVYHSRPMKTNNENDKFHRVTNHDKQGVFLQGDGGVLLEIFGVFTKNFPNPPSPPLKKNPLFIMICHSMENKKSMINFHGGSVINHDKQGGSMEKPPLFIMVCHLMKTNEYG